MNVQNKDVPINCTEGSKNIISVTAGTSGKKIVLNKKSFHSFLKWRPEGRKVMEEAKKINCVS